MFEVIVFAVAIVAGATASIVGFGIGSLLTPLLAFRLDTGTAVAAVMLPHAFGTALRCWRLRRDIDASVLRRFGLLSAAGSLAGAVLYSRLRSNALTHVLGALLILTAAAHLTGLSRRWHPRGTLVAVLGLASGLFGGLVGNQGGLRAAAMSSFALSPVAFVATSTATGLLVDAARAPVYVWLAGRDLLQLAGIIAIALAGVAIGTLVGERMLLGMAPVRFARVVAIAIGVLGVWLLRDLAWPPPA